MVCGGTFIQRVCFFCFFLNLFNSFPGEFFHMFAVAVQATPGEIEKAVS
jgi:hypothetical protein